MKAKKKNHERTSTTKPQQKKRQGIREYNTDSAAYNQTLQNKN
jgi:hypothetical protein